MSVAPRDPAKRDTATKKKIRCSICNHKKRHEIDDALVTPGASLRDIARQFGVSKDSLSRHVKGGHILEKIQKAKNAHEALAADTLLNRIQRRYARFEKLAENAQEWGDPELELKIYREESRFMELEGKATGAFREKVEVSGTLETQIKTMTDEEVLALARKVL